MAAAAAGHRMDLSISRPYIDTASTYWRGREKWMGRKKNKNDSIISVPTLRIVSNVSTSIPNGQSGWTFRLNALALLYKQTSDNKRLKEIKEIHKLPLFLFGAVCWIYFDSDRFIHSQSLSLKLSGFQSKWRTVYLFRVFFILFFTIPPRSSAFHHLIKVADISTIWADRTYPLEGKKKKNWPWSTMWFGDS